MQLPVIPVDKANHAVYGAVIFIVAAAACNALGQPAHARQAGIAAALVVACTKELIDWLLNRRAIAAGLPPPHGVEAGDVVGTLAGALLCMAATLVVHA